eukprot:gene20048-23999_t
MMDAGQISRKRAAVKHGMRLESLKPSDGRTRGRRVKGERRRSVVGQEIERARRTSNFALQGLFSTNQTLQLSAPGVHEHRQRPHRSNPDELSELCAEMLDADSPSAYLFQGITPEPAQLDMAANAGHELNSLSLAIPEEEAHRARTPPGRVGTGAASGGSLEGGHVPMPNFTSQALKPQARTNLQHLKPRADLVAAEPGLAGLNLRNLVRSRSAHSGASLAVIPTGETVLVSGDTCKMQAPPRRRVAAMFPRYRQGLGAKVSGANSERWQMKGAAEPPLEGGIVQPGAGEEAAAVPAGPCVSSTDGCDAVPGGDAGEEVVTTTTTTRTTTTTTTTITTTTRRQTAGEPQSSNNPFDFKPTKQLRASQRSAAQPPGPVLESYELMPSSPSQVEPPPPDPQGQGLQVYELLGMMHISVFRLVLCLPLSYLEENARRGFPAVAEAIPDLPATSEARSSFSGHVEGAPQSSPLDVGPEDDQSKTGSAEASPQPCPSGKEGEDTRSASPSAERKEAAAGPAWSKDVARASSKRDSAAGSPGGSIARPKSALTQSLSHSLSLLHRGRNPQPPSKLQHAKSLRGWHRLKRQQMDFKVERLLGTSLAHAFFSTKALIADTDLAVQIELANEVLWQLPDHRPFS